VAADTGAPLRRAVVQTFAPGQRTPRATSTDQDGRFELRDLPAGRYTITAMKGGYVSLQFGQRRPFEPGRPVELSEGQTFDNVDIALPPGGVIAGRLTDDFGEPVTDAMVLALRWRFAGGQRRLAPAGRSNQTNDVGEYRIFGLMPGEYFVTANVRTPGGFGVEASDLVGYAPTFYPGTPSAKEAQRVSVAVGQEARADFAVVPAKLSQVTGMVVGVGGRPVTGGFISVRPVGNVFGVALFAGGPIRPDGTFLASNLPPGEYVLIVGSGGAMDPRPDEPEFGRRRVTVADGDLTNVVITMTRGARLTGRVVAENGLPPANLRPSEVRLITLPADPDEDAGPGGMAGTLQDDWTFDIPGILGRRLVRVLLSAPGWSVRAVTLGGQDVSDEPIDFPAAGVMSDVEVVLSNRATELSGAVTNSRGEPVQDCTVVLFADDPDRWQTVQSRYVSSGRPDQDGRYKIRGLPPGSYLAIAVEFVEQGEWMDPEILERWRPLGTPLRLGDGETKALNLKLTPGA
jgi:hypothetical protein